MDAMTISAHALEPAMAAFQDQMRKVMRVPVVVVRTLRI
jgi:hypothetical protein